MLKRQVSGEKIKITLGNTFCCFQNFANPANNFAAFKLLATTTIIV